jgi:hypothetical protein
MGPLRGQTQLRQNTAAGVVLDQQIAPVLLGDGFRNRQANP